MSGGSLDYFYSSLEDHVGDFGDMELDELVKDLAKLFHDREWFLSSDTCEGSWVEARDTFKKKWFSEHGRQERIEKYLDDVRNQVLSSFGMSNKYCRTCRRWTPEEDGSRYGTCEYEKHCLTHRSETCEKWEGQEETEPAPDGDGEWIHKRTIKSQLFECSKCGGVAYYPQSNNANGKDAGPKIMYQYCPYCRHRMKLRP